MSLNAAFFISLFEGSQIEILYSRNQIPSSTWKTVPS